MMLNDVDIIHPLMFLYAIIFCVIFILGIYLLVKWHTKTHKYRCLDCGSEFKISAFTTLFSLNKPTRKGYLKLLVYPNCSKRVWTKMMREKVK